MTTLPAGRPLAGRWVRLEMLSEADLDEMYPIFSDPAVYADGYVMHHCPESPADAHDLARSVFLADQGALMARAADAPPMRSGRQQTVTSAAPGPWRARPHSQNPASATKVSTSDRQFTARAGGELKSTPNARSQAAILKLGATREGSCGGT